MSPPTVLAHRFQSYAYPGRDDALALLSTTGGGAACLPSVYLHQNHSAALHHHQRLPLRPAEQPPAGFHTSPFHPRQHAITGTMSDAGPYEPSEQELADLQKLSSEYEPEVTVSLSNPGGCDLRSVGVCAASGLIDPL